MIKRLLPVVLLLGLVAEGEAIGSLRGFFPLVVRVADEQGAPLQGVNVRIEGHGIEEEGDCTNPVDRLVRCMPVANRAIASDGQGRAPVYVWAKGFADMVSGHIQFPESTFPGTLVIEKPGYKRVVLTLRDLFTGMFRHESRSGSAPGFFLYLDKE